jgi:hypothetical protein
MFEDLHTPPGLNQHVGREETPKGPFSLVGKDETDAHLRELSFAIHTDEWHDLPGLSFDAFLGLNTTGCNN